MDVGRGSEGEWGVKGEVRVKLGKWSECKKVGENEK